ncbi:MAG TPA: TauD/TfdA family dioxygenase [Gemmatimonadota bacterium]|nr:TauD/TfdA family dioxygenase [Gemmatimonadota bacterium]
MALTPTSPRLSLDSALETIAAAREGIDALLERHGAVLLRGILPADTRAFDAALARLAPDLKPYVEGQSQRSRVEGKIYTSTEYPADQEIVLHNELSYTREPPRRLFFFCLVPPETGGETPIVDCRLLRRVIDSDVRGPLVERGVRYVKNMHGGGGFGKSWQDHFETEERAVVESYLQSGDVEYRWGDDGALWTSQVRPAEVSHPLTDEIVWFNQADLWHWSALGARGASLLRVMGPDRLPTNACYGDGDAIPVEHMDATREARRREAVWFPWQAGDLLVLDNHLVAHGRRPFTGARRILVAMA